MQLSSSDIYRAYRPSPCDLRLYLFIKGSPAAEPGAFEEVIRRLGERHEKAHLATLQNVTDLSVGTLDDRRKRTLEAIAAGSLVIYQPVFSAAIKLGNRDCQIVGIPDLLIREGEAYVIRDVKMARRLTEKDHIEIFWQLRLYGLLLRLATGQVTLRLEVFGGASKIVPIDAAADDAVKEELSRYVEVMLGGEPPFAPVGWTKCGGCAYHDTLGIFDYNELLIKLDEPALAAVQKPWGQKTQKVGKAAADILRSARALQSGKYIAIAAPDIPPGSNFVMFDLEGLPPNIRRGSDVPEAPVHVWFLDDAVSNEQSAKLTDVLSSDELQRARGYRQVRDRKRFTARRGMLRILIGYYLGCAPESVRFSTSEFGRPMLQWPNADLCFSVTQTDRLALIAFAWDCRIGIDAERMTDKLDLSGIGDEVFSFAEQEMVTASPPEVRCETFFKIWTRKEAFLKALGTGLSRKPKSFTTSNFPKAVPGRWCVFEQGIAITGWTQYDLVLEHDLKVALAVSLDTPRVTVQSCALLV